MVRRSASLQVAPRLLLLLLGKRTGSELLRLARADGLLRAFPAVRMRFDAGRAVRKTSARATEAGRHEDQIVVGRGQVADGHGHGDGFGVVAVKKRRF